MRLGLLGECVCVCVCLSACHVCAMKNAYIFSLPIRTHIHTDICICYILERVHGDSMREWSVYAFYSNMLNVRLYAIANIC